MGFFGVYTKLHELSINGVKAEDQDDDTVPNTDEYDDTQDPPAGEPTGDDGTDGGNAGDDDTVLIYDDGADGGDDTTASDTTDGPDQTGGDANPDTDDTAQQADTRDDDTVPTYDDGADDTGDNYDIPDGAEPPADGDAPEADSADDTEGEDAVDAGADAGEPTGDDDTVPTYDGAGDDGADDGTTDTGETDTVDAGGSQIANDLKSMEDEIFADLSDQQKDIRDNELKTQYINLYNVINDAEKRINNITKNEQTGRVLEFITRKMNELKQLIHHNLTKVYITRTYTENQTALQQCIAIMNIICNMLDSIAQEDQKEIG